MTNKPKKGQELELEIESLVYGGKGIAQHEGYKIFVADTVPGDKVKARLFKRKKSYGEARLLEVLKPSSQRKPARCKHFERCGGCKWQFLSYEDQLEAKEQQVRDVIERLAGLNGDLVQPIVPCEEPWFYRNKMEVSFGPGETGSWLGFYPPGYHYEVFNLEECFLMSEEMAPLVKKVRDWANEHGLPHYHSGSHEGILRNLIIREGKNTGEKMVILVTNPGFDQDESFTALLEGEVSSLYRLEVHQEKGKRTEIHEHHLAGKEVLTEKLHLENGQALDFDIKPQAFFQTNTHQAELLYSKALEAAGLTGEEVLFDLYCGTGTIGLFCAHAAKEVIGVEINASAVENARSNAEKNGIQNIDFHLGSVDKVLEERSERPDVIIVDPPRAGLGEKVVEQVAAFASEKIVYVSCNPTTLARDLKQFESLDYFAKYVLPIDMFPQTHHIECVCLLEKSYGTQ